MGCSDAPRQAGYNAPTSPIASAMPRPVKMTLGEVSPRTSPCAAGKRLKNATNDSDARIPNTDPTMLTKHDSHRISRMMRDLR